MAQNNSAPSSKNNIFSVLQLIGIVIVGLSAGIGLLYHILNINDSLFEISGSNTLGETLTPELAKAFMMERINAQDVKIRHRKNKETLIVGWVNGKRKTIKVNAHGSTTGFDDLANSNCDISLSSRLYRESERSNVLNARKGDISTTEYEHIVAMDGVAIIVHPSRQLNMLTMQQVADIFSCNIENWSQLAQKRAPIDIYIRDEKSGTHSIFVENLMLPFSRSFCHTAKIMETNESLAEKVANNVNAIGFVPISEIKDNQVIYLKTDNLSKIGPTLFEIAIEKYPLSRRLFFYTSKETNDIANSFVGYCLSDKGQAIVDSLGFVSLNPAPHFNTYAQMDAMTKSSLPQNYQNAIDGANQLPITIRFNQKTLRVDSKGVVDLKRVSQLLKKLSKHEIILIGFSDDQNEAFIQEELSNSMAETVQRELIDSGIEPNRFTIFGLGNSYPISTNATPSGRTKNRRVEIWLKAKEN